MGRGAERRAGGRGQERLHLRHYDVKLLNFFLTSAPAPAPASADGVAGAAAGVSGLALGEAEEAEGGDAEEAEARAEARAFWAQPGRAWVYPPPPPPPPLLVLSGHAASLTPY